MPQWLCCGLGVLLASPAAAQLGQAAACLAWASACLPEGMSS